MWCSPLCWSHLASECLPLPCWVVLQADDVVVLAALVLLAFQPSLTHVLPVLRLSLLRGLHLLPAHALTLRCLLTPALIQMLQDKQTTDR